MLPEDVAATVPPNDGAEVMVTLGVAPPDDARFPDAVTLVTDPLAGGMIATAAVHVPLIVTLPEVYAVSATLTYELLPRSTVSAPELVSVFVYENDPGV